MHRKVELAINMDGSPGLVVNGGDSKSEGCEFESQHQILDGHFITFIYCKNCNVCLKKAGVGPF